MSRMANSIDLDKDLGFSEDEVTHTKKVKLLGKEWTLVCDLNAFAMAQIASGESAGVSQFIINLVVPSQQEEFAQALRNAKNMTGERLGLLLSKLIEVAGERPTVSPSRSPRTAKRSPSSLKSVAR